MTPDEMKTMTMNELMELGRRERSRSFYAGWRAFRTATRAFLTQDRKRRVHI